MFKQIFKSTRSLSFELDNDAIYFSPEEYDVKVDGVVVLSKVKRNVFSLYDLKPKTKYIVEVLGVSKIVSTDEESTLVNVKDFGAKGDGKFDDTAAIQAALIAAPKGATILIPAGTYLVRPLFLVSDITVYLAKGATLLGETDRTKYPILPPNYTLADGRTFEVNSWEGVPDYGFASIITALRVKNVKIVGEGIIDANAQNSDWWLDSKVKRIAWRPKGVFLSNCENIGLHGITVKNTPSWNLHPYFCQHVDFIDLFIQSPAHSPNTDGCDPESCDHVNIIGVNFSVGDDCIAIKSGKIDMGKKYKKPTSNVTIRNCLMDDGHGGVVLGSEMSGGVKDLTVKQCYFRNTDRGLRIKTRRGRGETARIDGITFEKIYMENVLAPFTGNMFYHCDPDGRTDYVKSKEKLPVDDRTPYLGCFTFKDITCVNAEGAAAYFYGLPEQPIGSITLENVSVTVNPKAKIFQIIMACDLDDQKKLGFVFRNVDKVVAKNVSITGQDGDAFVLENVNHFRQTK